MARPRKGQVPPHLRRFLFRKKAARSGTTTAKKSRKGSRRIGSRIGKGLNKNALIAGGLSGAFAGEAARISPYGPPVAEIAVGVYMGVEAAQYVGARTLGAMLRQGSQSSGASGGTV